MGQNTNSTILSKVEHAHHKTNCHTLQINNSDMPSFAIQRKYKMNNGTRHNLNHDTGHKMNLRTMHKTKLKTSNRTKHTMNNSMKHKTNKRTKHKTNNGMSHKTKMATNWVCFAAMPMH